MSDTCAGACFCGAVEVEVTGTPGAMGYCRCRSCRSWSGARVNAFPLRRPDAVRLTRGAEHVTTYCRTDLGHRRFCRLCGGHLLMAHPPLGLVDVLAATIPDLPFRPGPHVNYAETVPPMRDGLPKPRDFPAGLGGSDETMPE